MDNKALERLKGLKRSPVRKYYLNDYVRTVPRFRIESVRGGERTVWTERTSLRKMEQTKRYLDSVWR